MNKKFTTQNQIINKLIQLIFILVGLELIAMSVTLFYAPHSIAAGGATGVSILLNELFNIPLAATLLVLNIIMLILSYIFLGKVTTAKITFGSIVLPAMIAITPKDMVIKDTFLSAVIGSIIFGVGLSILYRFDTPSGGTTVPPMIFKKYFHIRNANSLFVIDAIVCLGNIVAAGWEAFFLAILSVGLSTIVINYIETGIDKKQIIYIMSETHIEEIKDTVINNIDDIGGTYFNVQGMYSEDDKKMLMIVTESQNYGAILKIIRAIDKDAFILADSMAEVHNGSI
ncbi:membrane protein [Companilactobacillus sp. RD055328]|uniref:YitT family protein n=1 Tax=Companilactobacillus sp. RD055328 TaxID=2916634 RepID=UPI001FC8735E|nr:YitT family protein [Companilactobacillus sp. RD055328]GKQ42363.1 membrane protein [Companilactobacillus sp. RD055328]